MTGSRTPLAEIRSAELAAARSVSEALSVDAVDVLEQKLKTSELRSRVEPRIDELAEAMLSELLPERSD